jgi:radical SAM superfamily enzyme YgiQ (UPF0313 family)
MKGGYFFMKILLLYPTYPETFWSYNYALKFISKKASLPPLGLLTVAALLPVDWEKKLVDLSAGDKLQDQDIKWADYVFIGAMSIQRKSARELIDRCKRLGATIVAGGPLFTTSYQDFRDVDYLVLNEAEVTLPVFLNDLQNGKTNRIYTSSNKADMLNSPIPAWELIDNLNKYNSLCLQYSRGCPFNCDFCDVTLLFGHKVRTKSREQLLKELDKLYQLGWREGIFIVDDNFIANKRKLREEVLPAMIRWNKGKNGCFSFGTQASINLADEEDIMSMMVEAGFDSVFIGIETPNEESLEECHKNQNRNRNLIQSIHKVQQYGMQVTGGFIVGFDHDPPDIFEKMINFIQNSGIVTAMVGLLNAPIGTKLYHRLVKENRFLKYPSGSNTDFSINFIPKMKYNDLLKGYQKIMKTIYSPRYYYSRVLSLLKNLNIEHFKSKTNRFRWIYLIAFFKSIWYLGIIERGRIYYWKVFFWTLFHRPKLFPAAITYSITGFHFRKIFNIKNIQTE